MLWKACVYAEFAIYAFKNVSSFIFKYNTEISISTSLYRDDFDFLIEIFTLDKFFEDLFIIYFSEDTIGIFIYDIECVIIEIKECLVEKHLLEFFWGSDMISRNIMMKKIMAYIERL